MSDMHVVATAGHVDHGKSTLVRALTGMEPDRLAEEKRRGLTVDLGYAWTTTASGDRLAFVDVPGHRRFIGNMLAGIGPAPAVMFVVAADGGWEAQSDEHLAALDALAVRHGLLVVTRSDLADPGPALAAARRKFASTSLAHVPDVAVSARTGAGLPRLRELLDDLALGMPAPRIDGPVRLWIDRVFPVVGAGTVVTGTLSHGTLAVGDELELTVGTQARDRRRVRVRVRGLECLGEPRERVPAPARVAVNLRGVEHGDVHRGQSLLTPGSLPETVRVDVVLDGGAGERWAQAPAGLTLHLGTAGVEVHRRPLGPDAARLTLAHPLPVAVGDRVLLRDPGDASGHALWGARVVEADPAELTRRGEAARRGDHLAAGPLDLLTEVERRGRLTVDRALALGLDPSVLTPDEPRVRRIGALLVSAATWDGWAAALAGAVDAHAAAHPLDPRMSLKAAADAAGLPDPETAAVVATGRSGAGLEVERGRVGRPGARPDLGAAEAGLARWEERWRTEPFAAPEADDLAAAGLDAAHVAAAAALGRLVRLRDEVVLSPTAPARAMRVLAALPQPFTTSEARQALGTTRRVAIPLLEHLDTRGWTRRLDGGHREVRR